MKTKKINNSENLYNYDVKTYKMLKERAIEEILFHVTNEDLGYRHNDPKRLEGMFIAFNVLFGDFEYENITGEVADRMNGRGLELATDGRK